MKINNYKSAFWLLVVGLVFFILGKIFFEIYNSSPQKVVDIEKFQKVFSQKEKQAQQTVAFMEKKVSESNTLDSLESIDFQGNDIIYYVYQNNRLVFWSDNLIAPSNGIDFQANTTNYIKLPNNNCVYVCRQSGDLKFVALILLKFSYSTETEILNNYFVRDFRTDPNVLIVQGSHSDNYTISGSEGEYLFSMQIPSQPIYTDFWLKISFFAYLFFFLIFFTFYALIPKIFKSKQLEFSKFLMFAAAVGAVMFFALFYQIPKGFFLGAALVFEQFYANEFICKFGHFNIFTFYCLSTFYLLYQVDTAAIFKRYKFSFLFGIIAFFVCFVLFSNLLHGIIFRSAAQISILQFDDFSFSRLWLHGLFAMWGLGFIFLFFKTFAWIEGKRNFLLAAIINLIFLCIFCVYLIFIHNQYWLLFCISYIVFLTMFLLILHYGKNFNFYSNALNATLLVVMTVLLSLNIFYFEKQDRKNEFRKIAEKILTQNTDQTVNQISQLETLNSQIAADQTLKNLAAEPNLLDEAKRYFEEEYLTDKLSNYESAIYVYKKNSVDLKNYKNLINEYGTQVSQSAFYQISAPQSTNSFVGIFPFFKNDSLFFVINLEPIRNFRSYSFPNLLTNSDNHDFSNLKIATAKYSDGNLISSTGRFAYPATSYWLSNINGADSSFFYNRHENFVFAAANGENSVAVVTDLGNHKFINYFVYFFYEFLICFLLAWLLVWIISALNHKQLKLNIITRFQYLFLLLFLLSFVGVFSLSSEFIKNRYRERQNEAINEKMTYIQKVLQEKYFYNLTLNDLVSGSLTNVLQDISYTFQTDIHIFDNNGIFITSTQPIIFNKNLISRRIAPEILFSNKSSFSQNRQIGNLNYIVNYSEFLNGDNLQIGYIAIPQYFSQTEIDNGTENFLKYIIHIYVIALVISLIFSNIIRKQLSKPLLDLENKLRAMRIGKRNEKIEYKSNDEISQLVEQYNITVDELDRSAQLLAKSERQSAWKLMALQIAHEINNPLTPMKLSIQQLQRTKKMNDSQFDEYFEKSTQMLVEQIDNLSYIASTFSNFAKLPEAKFEKTNFKQVINSAVELFKNNDKNVIINYLFPEKDIFVFADPEQLQRVFNNLLKNAIQAIADGQTEKLVEVKLQSIDNKAVATVTDNGCGISPDIADKLFVPSFTTKSAGMGLGLPISKSIVETADGTITFNSKTGVGTTFRVEFAEII